MSFTMSGAPPVTRPSPLRNLPEVESFRNGMWCINMFTTPEIRVDRGRHSVAFWVEVAADFHSVARFLLIVVFVHRRLEQERVFALRVANAFDAHLRRADEHRRLGVLHELPHLLVCRYSRRLQRQSDVTHRLTLVVELPESASRTAARRWVYSSLTQTDGRKEIRYSFARARHFFKQ